MCVLVQKNRKRNKLICINIMKEIYELNIEVERVKGDIRLIRQSIETIETNHLAHIERDIANIRKVIWTVGFMVFGQFIVIIKDLILP
jgi:ribosome-interacting GTPase 1